MYNRPLVFDLDAASEPVSVCQVAPQQVWRVNEDHSRWPPGASLVVVEAQVHLPLPPHPDKPIETPAETERPAEAVAPDGTGNNY